MATDKMNDDPVVFPGWLGRGHVHRLRLRKHMRGVDDFMLTASQCKLETHDVREHERGNSGVSREVRMLSMSPRRENRLMGLQSKKSYKSFVRDLALASRPSASSSSSSPSPSPSPCAVARRGFLPFRDLRTRRHHAVILAFLSASLVRPSCV